ncbi:MAG: histidine kinase, partial [Kiloniellaceae bacterium]
VALCAIVAAILLTTARWSVAEEVESAFSIAEDIIAERGPRLSQAPETMLAAVELAREIDSLRHVAAYVTDPVGVVVAEGSGRAAVSRDAPGWFADWVGQDQMVRSFPVTRYPNILGTIRLATDPADEIDEVWEDFSVILPVVAGAGMLAMVSALGMVLMVLHRIRISNEALARMRSGDLSARVPRQRLAEFAALADGVNALAAHLCAEREEIRRLQRRLITLSETERRLLATDLHDGVGPRLFALRATVRDAQLLVGTAPEKVAGPLGEALEAIQVHSEEIQKLVRSAIANLRPMLAGDATLGEMLRDMAASFSDIAPSVRIDVEAEDLNTGEAGDLCFYRFAQESVLNAIRHGAARQVRIELRREQEGEGTVLIAQVNDDGRGPPNGKAKPNYGLVGIMDRAKALDATFCPPERRQDRTMTELRLRLDRGHPLPG